MTAASGAPVRVDFDVCGPLPSRTTVLEASAGTGKTWTIAALTARYIAEGVAELGDLMLVTFGRMASNELRLRVRERLVAVEAQLTAALAPATLAPAAASLGTQTGPAPGPDRVAALILDAEPAELERRHARVARALAEFDAATIATTHEFCLQMLDGLGVLGDSEPQAGFVEHLGDLTREVATDLYLRRYATSGLAPMTHAEAVRVADQAVSAVHSRLVPSLDEGSGADEGSDAAQRVAFAAQIRAEVERRKRSGRLFTYDDMLTRLRDSLADPEHGPAAARRLRDRFRIVMVDEFQDTDPIQWEILERAFHGYSTLILIGDPKQAIYAFRGADVYSYLDAVTRADDVRTLGTNWRSDAAVVDALEALVGGASLGDDDIVVRPVTADHQDRRLRTGAEPVPALRLRVRPHEVDAEKVPSVGTLRPAILADLVADVTALLASGSEVNLNGVWRPLEPADIAVLVRKNERGEAIRDRLMAAGVPAVMHGANSVFASPTAQDWLTLLVALEQPRQLAARQAALTCFFGWTFTDLATADEDALIELAQKVRWWSKLLAARGVAALLETISVENRVPERLLSVAGGERQLTDLRHLAQSLHAAMTSGQLGVGALVQWLRDRIADTQRNAQTEGTRRLETDAKAVTILTVHRSKGLEFPVVYLPEAWDRFVNARDEGGTLRLHEAGTDGRTESVLDVGGRFSPGRAERFARHRLEDAGEDLRLLYVALTRAQCQVVAWWAPSVNTPASALQRFLYRAAGSPTGELPASYPLSGDPMSLRVRSPSTQLEPIEARLPVPWRVEDDSTPRLSLRTFDRSLDLEWRRTSYSALTAAVHGVDLSTPAVGSEPELAREDDESELADTGAAGMSVDPVGEADGLDRPSPMAELPMGVEFGTAVHAVFELVDPGAGDLEAALTAATATVLARSAAGSMTVQQLASGLLPAYLTSLGPLADGRRLSDIPRRDQLAELGFEFGLAGGEVTTADVRLGGIAPLLRRHLPAGDPLTTYADRLDHPALADQTLRGYLTGSIDAVLRVGDTDETRRYLVVDYKTNWLGSMDGPVLTLGDYRPDRLAEAMMHAHYPLQALLYSVAVHRMLRWRQPGYRPEQHLGGVLYLFVRGMAGPDTPEVDGVPCGVFSWRPPAALVVALSELLDGAPK